MIVQRRKTKWNLIDGASVVLDTQWGNVEGILSFGPPGNGRNALGTNVTGILATDSKVLWFNSVTELIVSSWQGAKAYRYAIHHPNELLTSNSPSLVPKSPAAVPEHAVVITCSEPSVHVATTMPESKTSGVQRPQHIAVKPGCSKCRHSANGCSACRKDSSNVDTGALVDILPRDACPKMEHFRCLVKQGIAGRFGSQVIAAGCLGTSKSAFNAWLNGKCKSVELDNSITKKVLHHILPLSNSTVKAAAVEARLVDSQEPSHTPPDTIEEAAPRVNKCSVNNHEQGQEQQGQEQHQEQRQEQQQEQREQYEEGEGRERHEKEVRHCCVRTAAAYMRHCCVNRMHTKKARMTDEQSWHSIRRRTGCCKRKKPSLSSNRDLQVRKMPYSRHSSETCNKRRSRQSRQNDQLALSSITQKKLKESSTRFRKTF